MDLTAINTINNQDENRFELWHHKDLLAFIDYKIGKSGNWYLVHTEVVVSEGKGIGHKIVREALDLIDEMNVKIIPSCPFVKAYIKKHQEDYGNLLADGVKL